MGYQATTVTPANMAPRAQAELPSMMICPSVWWSRSTRSRSWRGASAEAQSKPACTARLVELDGLLLAVQLLGDGAS